MTRSDRSVRILSYTILSVLIVVMIFPFLWMAFSSFKSTAEIYSQSYFPENPIIDNYQEIFNSSLFLRWLMNSAIIAIVTTISVLFFDSLVGFTLAKYQFPGKKIIFALIISTLMIPTEMLVIPWYIMSSRFGWLDSYWGIMFPGMMSAFGVFLMRQFMDSVPGDLL